MRHWIKFITILYEKAIKEPRIYKNRWKKALELKKICNHYLHKRKEIMETTKFTVEDTFGDVISQDSISPEQIAKLNNFLAKIM